MDTKKNQKVKRPRLHIYIDIIIDSLKYYESHREKYPNLDFFYPQIIKDIQKKSI